MSPCNDIGPFQICAEQFLIFPASVFGWEGQRCCTLIAKKPGFFARGDEACLSSVWMRGLCSRHWALLLSSEWDFFFFKQWTRVRLVLETIKDILLWEFMQDIQCALRILGEYNPAMETNRGLWRGWQIFFPLPQADGDSFSKFQEYEKGHGKEHFWGFLF